MSKEQVDEIVDDLLNNRLELTSFVSENLEQAERVQELLDELETLSTHNNDLLHEIRVLKNKIETFNKIYDESLRIDSDES